MTSRAAHLRHTSGGAEPCLRGVSLAFLVGIVGAALTACAAGGLPAGSKAAGQGVSTETRPPPSVTAACPVGEGQQAPPGCVPYDGELAMRANEAYRQRVELSKDLQAKAGTHLVGIKSALEGALKTGPVDRPSAVRVLTPLGYDASSVQAYGRSNVPGGFAIGVATDAGCVFGGIRGEAVVLETGGGIADGGCLPAQGH